MALADMVCTYPKVGDQHSTSCMFLHPPQKFQRFEFLSALQASPQPNTSQSRVLTLVFTLTHLLPIRRALDTRGQRWPGRFFNCQEPTQKAFSLRDSYPDTKLLSVRWKLPFKDPPKIPVYDGDFLLAHHLRHLPNGAHPLGKNVFWNYLGYSSGQWVECAGGGTIFTSEVSAPNAGDRGADLVYGRTSEAINISE